MSKLRITWTKSCIGYAQDQRSTLEALGLKRLNQKVERADSPSVRGMLLKVKHLVKVEEIEG
jgi:large subunit ribosomal protein L30